MIKFQCRERFCPLVRLDRISAVSVPLYVSIDSTGAIGVGYESITYRGTISTLTLPFTETIGQISNVKNYAKFCYATSVPTLHPRGSTNVVLSI
jgi:hypothetical protein